MKVFYNPNQVAENNISFSPSAGKPKLVINSWKSKFDIEIVNFEPLKIEDFYRTHYKNYVDDIFSCRIPNGFDNKLKEVADSLYWTNGSFYAASEFAIKNKINTCAPVSGFHHACWNRPEGFCTFNGLIIAAQKLYEQKLVNNIAIVDIDMHYGNGTVDLINKHSINYIDHYTFGRDSSTYSWNGGSKAKEWLNELPLLLQNFKNADLVMYQAGADPYQFDPYGGALTLEQLQERDKIVFSTFKQLGIPVVWNLAGGYTNPIQTVLDIHDATMKTCIEIMRS